MVELSAAGSVLPNSRHPGIAGSKKLVEWVLPAQSATGVSFE
jgi:hypothetical protein